MADGYFEETLSILATQSTSYGLDILYTNILISINFPRTGEVSSDLGHMAHQSTQGHQLLCSCLLLAQQ